MTPRLKYDNESPSHIPLIRTIFFNPLQVAVVLVFAPLASGVLSRLKEMGAVQSAGRAFFSPIATCGSSCIRTKWSPNTLVDFSIHPLHLFCCPDIRYSPDPCPDSYPLFFAFMGDMLGGGFVLALGGFFATLAAIDSANPYGPIGASRTRMVGFLAEPVFMIVFFTVSFVAGSTIPYIVQQKWVVPRLASLRRPTFFSCSPFSC